MSYDVYGEIDTGGPEPHEVWWENHTSNTAGMWRAAGVDLAAYDQQPADRLRDALGEAIIELRRNHQVYRRMDSPNGWGTYDTTLAFLERLHRHCVTHPNTTIRISR